MPPKNPNSSVRLASEQPIDPRDSTDPSDQKPPQKPPSRLDQVYSQVIANATRRRGYRFTKKIQPVLVVDNTGVLNTEFVPVGKQFVPILAPTFRSESESEGHPTSVFGSSEAQSTPPSSVHHSPQSSIDSKMKMASFTQPSLSAPLPPQDLTQIVAQGVTPADMIAHLSGPQCAFTSEQKTIVYKSILKSSILAYDAETDISRFSWNYEQLSSMDAKAKAATLLHSEHTISSLCAAFVKHLEAAELHKETEAGPRSSQVPFETHVLVEDAFARLMARTGRERLRELVNLKAWAALDPSSEPSSDTSGRFEDNKAGKAAGEGVAGALEHADIEQPEALETSRLGEKMAGLKKQLVDMERGIEKRKLEIKRLKVVSNDYNKQGILLKGKKAESESLAKQVSQLTERLTNLTNLVEETDAKNDLVQDSLRKELELKDISIAELKATVTRQAATIKRLEGKLETTKDNLEATKDELECVREDLESVQEELEKEKKETEVMRAAMLGDEIALGAIQLRAILDRIKKDLCDIAGIINSNPARYATAIESHAAKYGYTLFQASMDIFCRAKKVVDELTGQYTAYVSMFSTAHFYKSFDLIFSNASELRFVANGLAHKELRDRAFNSEDLIRKSCPVKERKITRLVLRAFVSFRPIHERLQFQSLEEGQRRVAFDTKRPKRKGRRWARLGEWLEWVQGEGDDTANVTVASNDADDEDEAGEDEDEEDEDEEEEEEEEEEDDEGTADDVRAHGGR